jgi:hypothetical protein
MNGINKNSPKCVANHNNLYTVAYAVDTPDAKFKNTSYTVQAIANFI